MTYRLVSYQNTSVFSYYNLLLIVLGCIIIYIIHTGFLNRKNVDIGSFNKENYEKFQNI